jgi:hypothetical protein
MATRERESLETHRVESLLVVHVCIYPFYLYHVIASQVWRANQTTVKFFEGPEISGILQSCLPDFSISSSTSVARRCREYERVNRKGRSKASSTFAFRGSGSNPHQSSSSALRERHTKSCLLHEYLGTPYRQVRWSGVLDEALMLPSLASVSLVYTSVSPGFCPASCL